MMESFEKKLGLFLRYGVSLSGFLILSGWVLRLCAFPCSQEKIVPILPMHFTDWLLWFRNKDPAILIGIGLLLLLLLPLIRVLLTLVWFILHKDIRFVGFTLLVLGLIGIGIWLGGTLL